MSGQNWKKPFAEGSKSFRRHDFDGALRSLDEVKCRPDFPWLVELKEISQAVRLCNDKSYVLYDTRASVYETLSCFNYALRDAQKTIEIAPAQWHGYFRSARLLASQGQSDAALKMCTEALWKLGDGPQDETRRRELTELRQRLEAVPPRQCRISNLPVELLVTIFTLSNNPAVIAHVCHRWRAVAHSQPALWRNLVLGAAPRAGGNATQKIDEWNKRSSGWITELHIRKSLGTALFPSGVSWKPDPSEMYTDVVAALRRLDLTQLGECNTQDVATGLFLPALGLGDDGVNNLETLSSRCECPPYEAGWFGCNTLSWESLRSLSLAGVRCNWEELSASMRCLTSFEYKIHNDVRSFSQFHQFLQANAGTLEKIVIEVVVAFEDTSAPHFPVTPREPLTLTHLHHLELKGILPFHISHGNFTLPSIRILRIPWLKDAASEISSLIEDEGTSFAELVELTTRGRLVGRQNLSAILVRAPKLTILRCTDFDGVVAESLSKPCAAILRDSTVELPVLCPALSVLDLSWSPRLKTDPLVRIIKERIAITASEEVGKYQLPGLDNDQSVSCIQTLKVDGCPRIEEDKLPWFQENVPEFSCRYDLKRKN